MIRSGKKLRFTRSEIAEFREFGLELRGVKTQADWEAVLAFWGDTLAAEQPELLEKIICEMAQARDLEDPHPHAISPNQP